MQSLTDKVFALSREMGSYILISFVSAAVGWMAFYWETLILHCLHTFFPFYSHVPPIMSQLFLYSNFARLIDTVTQGLPWFYPWTMDRSLPLLKIMCVLFHSQITPGWYDTMGMIRLGQNFSLFQNEPRHCWWFRWWWQHRKIRSWADIARNIYSFNSC